MLPCSSAFTTTRRGAAAQHTFLSLPPGGGRLLDMPSLWLIVDWLPISCHPSSCHHLVVVVVVVIVVLLSCCCLVVIVVVIRGASLSSGSVLARGSVILASGGALSGRSSGSVVVRERTRQGWSIVVRGECCRWGGMAFVRRPCAVVGEECHRQGRSTVVMQEHWGAQGRLNWRVGGEF